MDLENYSLAFTDRMFWITFRCKGSHVDWLTYVWAPDVRGDEFHLPHLLCSGRAASEVDVGTEAIYPLLALLWLCTVKTHSVVTDVLTRSQGAKQVGDVWRRQPDSLNW